MRTNITQLVNELGVKMKDKKITLVTAESCTGGGLAYFISINPDSSSLLERGYVTYSNQSKESLLEVPPLAIQTHGAVSKEVAIAMAEGALKNSIAQIALSITGIAGPDCQPKAGKNAEGMVWMACSSKVHPTIVQLKKIRGQRQTFCKKVIEESLKYLLTYITK